MFLSESLQKKWAPVLEHESLPAIKDNYKRAVTAVILENQERAMREDKQSLFEAVPANNIADSGASNIDRYDPILISLVRRSLPNLMAYDVAGVQQHMKDMRQYLKPFLHEYSTPPVPPVRQAHLAFFQLHETREQLQLLRTMKPPCF